MAEKLGTTERNMRHMVNVFRQQGCGLFAPWKPGEVDEYKD